MTTGTALALAIVRVARGAARPSAEQLRHALDRDRAVLRLPPGDARNDLTVAGPYPVAVGDQQLDEYVVWER
jgi:hypothetical protein